MKVTIKDIAEAAGCSVTTVSFVLNGHDSCISEATKARVLEAMRKLNYRPNSIAASLVTGKTKIIGLIIPDNRNPLFAAILRQVQLNAELRGYRLVTCNSDDMASKDLLYLETLMDYRVDGIMIARSHPENKADESNLIKLLEVIPVPIIAIDRTITGAAIPTFSVKNELGGYIATKHLLEMGHRRIGCYSGPLSVSSAMQRLEGYRIALDEYGIAYDHDWVYEGNYMTDMHAEALEYFEKRNIHAVFSQNDMQAYGLYHNLQTRGRHIPGDFSIVGYDDLEFSSILVPGLTTVSFPIDEMARDAINYLIDLMEGKQHFTKENALVEYDPVLIRRGSVKLV